MNTILSKQCFKNLLTKNTNRLWISQSEFLIENWYGILVNHKLISKESVQIESNIGWKNIKLIENRPPEYVRGILCSWSKGL